ncbi:MAG TPA: M23 family metallopeptidase [Hyphomicrobiales bacterium]|nr:M23 family metallopeptidase [Hyphomicrobiales bacterium]
MKIILVDEKHGASRSLMIRGWVKAALGLCLLGLPAILGYYGYQLAEGRHLKLSKDEAAQAWADGLKEQQADLDRVKAETQTQLQALTIRLANLQARLIRLDALGERLTNAAGLDDGEFDFSQGPSVGGPESDTAVSFQQPDFVKELDRLAEQIESRQQQLDLLDTIMIEREHQEEFAVGGRPVGVGYISSGYGRRLDPFTGKVAWHQGLDFATGKTGEDVFAVAAGVVKFAGDTPGYGKLVQIDHGNGIETLYGHSQKLLVKEGDVVKKGQVITLSGSTGRSSGPHVHFEVHKNGRVVDPSSYIHSNIR